MPKIASVEAIRLENVPIEPPPFRDEPNTADALLVRLESDDGHVGWGMAGYAHPVMAHFINAYAASMIVGRDPLRTAAIMTALTDPRPESGFSERKLGRVLVSALSSIDIALWDLKARILDTSVHALVGGSRDKIPVYVTHGAAYGKAPVYRRDELAAEAKHLADKGNKFLKNTVGRQVRDGRYAPDPVDDYHRMKAMRDAVGPDIKLAMDGNSRMSAAEAAQLCRLTEELDIAFFEEPVVGNDPAQLHSLRGKTTIAIASAENHLYSAADLLRGDAIDILQPNVVNDRGYTGALKLANLAESHHVRLGHGNGGGPHNVALQAGLANGEIVEYHYHVWMTYNTIFPATPQPVDGYLTVPPGPGTGLVPRPEVIDEHRVSA